MNRFFSIPAALAMLTVGACGQAEPDVASTLPTHAAPVSADAVSLDDARVGYDALLAAHVDDLGFVDYVALQADPAALDAYVAALGVPGALPALDEQPDARLAELINAYNAFTLKLILNHHEGSTPPNSITDLHGGKPWDQAEWTLDGQKVSLNQIEHEMIRKEFPQEPRIHWAVVCAAFSCPPLRAEAYTPESLEEQLVDQERRVLLAGDPRFIRTDGDRVTQLTKLFEWYGGDFGSPWQPYVQQATGHAVDHRGFIDYDWKLNSQPNRP